MAAACPARFAGASARVCRRTHLAPRSPIVVPVPTDTTKKFEVLEREIRVQGGEAEKVRVLRSVYGPLVGEPDLKTHRAHSLKMSFWKSES